MTSTDEGCPWTTGDDENVVRCGRPTTHCCENAPDTCDLHKSACCLPKQVVTAVTEFPVERALSRDQRQATIASWAERAFSREEATSIPQRGLRLLEEAIEAFQACGGDEAIAHKLVSHVFGRPAGSVGQELGGVAVTVLALAAAAGLSADEEECREVHRVLSKPLGEFTQRNASKNAAGFKIAPPPPRNSCCGNVGTHGEGGREYCSTCGSDLGTRTSP
jgi:NTP pyrophosphatase (non-canonical NTP hydrolase)